MSCWRNIALYPFTERKLRRRNRQNRRSRGRTSANESAVDGDPLATAMSSSPRRHHRDGPVVVPPAAGSPPRRDAGSSSSSSVGSHGGRRSRRRRTSPQSTTSSSSSTSPPDIHEIHHAQQHAAGSGGGTDRPCACGHHRLDRCAWPQCNPRCPNFRNPFTDEEIDLVELLTVQFGVDVAGLARSVGLDGAAVRNMDHTELIRRLVRSTDDGR